MSLDKSIYSIDFSGSKGRFTIYAEMSPSLVGVLSTKKISREDFSLLQENARKIHMEKKLCSNLSSVGSAP